MRAALVGLLLFLLLVLAGCLAPEAPEAPTASLRPAVTAQITWDAEEPVVGEEVRFSVSVAGGGELAAVQWLIEGVRYHEPAPVHVFFESGTHTVQASVTTTMGDGAASRQITVAEARQPPEPSEPSDGPPPEPGPRNEEDEETKPEGGDALAPRPHVIVGVSDTGINPYHEIYYRAEATAHPCTYVDGYTDCSVVALHLTVGPAGGSYSARLASDAPEWDKVRPGQWYWIPQTNLIAVRCPDGGGTQGGRCILDDQSTHGTGTTSSVLTEAPDALIVFNEGSRSTQLATSPVPIDIESFSWGSPVPLYLGFVNGPTGMQVCHDSIDSPTSIKFRSGGNGGPRPNMGDCWRNGFRTFSVAGGYPDGAHHPLSASAPDFASYMCRPVASAGTLSEWRSACGTSFAAPTAAGAAAAALLEIRRELDYAGAGSTTHVAPGLTHEAFLDAVVHAATYDPDPRPDHPSSGTGGVVTSQTPWLWWGWGWLDSQVTPQIVDCAMGRTCPDNKPPEAWTFNEVRRSFASEGDG